MKSMRCFILLFLILSCITTLSYAQDHDHEHEHEVTNNSTQSATTPTSTSTLTPTPIPDNHEGHNHTGGEAGHEGHNHAEGEVAGGHEGHNHAEEEAGGHAGHSHASGFDEESCELEAHQEYNLNFRIGSLFIILATSAVGIFAPILLHQIKPYEENSLRAWILTIGKFFGTGVILSTAFVHMLPEAMERFSSPCLSEGWHSYHSFGAIFCMAAAFILQWIELAALSHMDALKAKKQQQRTESTIAEHKLEHGDMGHVHSAGFLESDQDDLSLRSISTLLLEFGIAVHSIIIGVTLGTSSETTFIVIFIALIFHQFFEGIALGTRINETNVKGSWLKPLIMGIIFICMTPIGIGIGIGVRTTMDVQSLLVSQAILDSISAGILLYNAYVSLMSVEISHSAKFRQYSFGKKSVCLISMYIGAAIMSVLGLWA
ncbi:ZIP zinc transporter-domain-containing protein [Cunninghamella echinulata]|nr:ZIP zinc transporter-domain-containing protein [Cunninghamella echinulata]